VTPVTLTRMVVDAALAAAAGRRVHRVSLWEAGDAPPGSIPSADTWSAHGPPDHAGWYLFLDASPVDAAFEKALRGALAERSMTSFAWVRYAAGSRDDGRVRAQR
jgi:hypothetical protein